MTTTKTTIARRGRRVYAYCSECPWQTTSTGPLAEGRVTKLADEHRCLPYPGREEVGE